jgi:hypothetical protein
MNKRYLPAIASLLLIAIVSTSFIPVFAALPTRLVAQPTLRVVTIAEDDELRQTGIMWMAPNFLVFTGFDPDDPDGLLPITSTSDTLAQFKILVSYNGVPVTPTSTSCQFVEKDKSHPLKNQQFVAENLVSVPKENTNFICKFRWGKPGVGVIDVYYTGDFLAQYIADYILVVGAALAVGRTTVTGTEIQDICLLGWPFDNENTLGSLGIPLAPNGDVPRTITKGNGDYHLIVPDALGPIGSCEDFALFQKDIVMEHSSIP